MTVHFFRRKTLSSTIHGLMVNARAGLLLVLTTTGAFGQCTCDINDLRPDPTDRIIAEDAHYFL